ncbi:aspartate decarboxylase [Neosynechococcus sphagnicola sy1]|uniref:Aspartate 1-decarboxylase n=1 Tax=Neosynechococcus sphagnicola sy1 TaxID=1497020 RepID=A0A098TM52_9CYAN|nr:aspartate 1-decarboxylase [Neosynechococcus sphagnicola]KGF71918.1 aspartate decarboxylase [Neosynechococcus sphagnicola sy1]
MQRTLLLAKIHGCFLTDANPDYVGSISIDAMLLEAAGIIPYEQVQVVNVTNGARLITYAIAAIPHSGAIELNGAAARLAVKGDRLIIMTYGQLSPEEVNVHHPKVVFVDQQNSLVAVYHYDELLSQALLLRSPTATDREISPIP